MTLILDWRELLSDLVPFLAITALFTWWSALIHIVAGGP
jgi:hypothetical protein